jgi:hypothetical protein
MSTPGVNTAVAWLKQPTSPSALRSSCSRVASAEFFHFTGVLGAIRQLDRLKSRSEKPSRLGNYECAWDTFRTCGWQHLIRKSRATDLGRSSYATS